MRESPFLWWAFFYMTVKSRIWWAFLTGTATKYRKLLFLPGGLSGYSPILVWSISITFVHRAEMKVPFLGSEICDFRGCTKRRWFMEPAGSHTSAPLELWAYLKCFHTSVMKKNCTHTNFEPLCLSNSGAESQSSFSSMLSAFCVFYETPGCT